MRQRHAHSQHSARDIALARLDRAQLPHLKPRVLKASANLAAADAEDKAAFVEALYVGVVKNLLPLRHRIEFHSGRPWRAFDPAVQKILLLAAYQLTGMDKVPPAIAVDQAVEQCRRFGQKHATGLVNAVLRNFLRQSPPPIPEDNPELRFSFPQPVWSKLLELLGQEKAAQFCQHANAKPDLTLRLGPGVAWESLQSPGLTVRPHDQRGMAVVEGANREVLTKWAEAGVAQPQDPTAAGVALLASVKPGMTVLDRCAGVGTKGVQLAELVGPAGKVDAMEVDPRRCQVLRDFAARRGLGHVRVIEGGTTREVREQLMGAGYDRVLTDVPCSNSGVLARRAEARYHQSKQELESLQKLQHEILRDSADFVAPGGWLVYSTCSVWPEENVETVRRFLREDTRFVLSLEQATWPALPGPQGTSYRDGGYVAVMVRHE